jgi:hypothetical protein
MDLLDEPLRRASFDPEVPILRAKREHVDVGRPKLQFAFIEHAESIVLR